MIRALFIASMAILTGYAQAQSFEVATVKPSDPAERGGTLYTPSGDRFAVTNMTLKDLISLAWDVRNFQVSGGPAWLDSNKYDIVAKADRPADLDHMKEMLRPLLTERFQLTFHHDTRELPVYLLIPAKNGPKVSPSTSEGPQLRGGKGQLTAKNIPVSILAAQLGNRLGRPVLDRTGLTGNFDIRLEWVPVDSPSADGPSLFTAVQEQLGLKLEAGRAPVDIIVIDRAEKPSEN